MEQLVAELIETGWLKTPAIISAFRATDRRDFVPDEMKLFAYENRALPVGWGQTISQPLTVAFMLEELQPRAGEKVLDIGFGSGWQTAMLSRIVGPAGTVCVIERIPELAAWGRANVERAGCANVHFFVQDGYGGLPDEAPFHRIIAAASALEIPPAWREQLTVGGRIVAPVGERIVVLEKQPDSSFIEQQHPGFSFVPFVHT